jgi:hypothetical protein
MLPTPLIAYVAWILRIGRDVVRFGHKTILFKHTDTNHCRGKMGQNPYIGQTEEEQGELAFQLLFNWYTTAVQAIVDSSNPEKALEVLDPYNRNANMAATFIIRDFFGLNPGDKYSFGFESMVVMNFMARAPVMKVSIHERGAFSRVSDCPFKRGPVEHCTLACGLGPNRAAEALGVVQSTHLVSSLSHGDEECRWITIYNGKGKGSMVESDLGGELASILSWPLPKELVDNFSIQYYAEWWMIAIRALIDQLGEQKAVGILAPYMKHNGISYGLKSSTKAVSNEGSQVRISSLVDQCGRALQMKTSLSSSNIMVDERTIEECPFKDAPAQVCSQLEAFFNGICEAIDPSYEFAYDRMMTKGDKTCHWMIRKKGEAEKMKVKGEAASDDPVKRLTNMFIEGDITEEEFRKKLAVLKELKL